MKTHNKFDDYLTQVNKINEEKEIVKKILWREYIKENKFKLLAWILIIIFSIIQICDAQQIYVFSSTDLNVASGNKWSMNEKPTFNIKIGVGYTWNRFTIYKSAEYLPKFNFERHGMNAEYKVFDHVFNTNFSTTFNIGYGRVYKNFNYYKSYNIGGKILYHIKDFEVFAEYTIDGRPDLPGDDKGHLKNKGKYQNVRSVYFGIAYRFKIF